MPSVTSKFHGTYQGRELEIIYVKMNNEVSRVSTEESLQFVIRFKRNSPSIKKSQIGVYIHNSADAGVVTAFSEMISLPEDKNEFDVTFSIPQHHLAKGSYTVDFSLSQFDFTAVPYDYDFVRRILSFDVKFVDASHTEPFVGWQPRLGSVITKINTMSIKSIDDIKA